VDIRPIGLFHSNIELANHLQRGSKFNNVSTLRSSVPIAVIDDEKFAPEDNLRNSGYKIVQLGDIKRIDDVREYSIVLCDLMGVGRYFDDQSQGASIIQEIRNRYPTIVVVAYTGASLGSAPARAAKQSADKVIKKDLDMSEWKDTLDELAKRAVNPHFVWARTRERMVQADVDTKTILILEDAYVRSVLSGDKTAGLLSKVTSGATIGADARSIVQNLIASAIFKLIVG
jgi:hypothetical protein